MYLLSLYRLLPTSMLLFTLRRINSASVWCLEAADSRLAKCLFLTLNAWSWIQSTWYFLWQQKPDGRSKVSYIYIYIYVNVINALRIGLKIIHHVFTGYHMMKLLPTFGLLAKQSPYSSNRHNFLTMFKTMWRGHYSYSLVLFSLQFYFLCLHTPLDYN